MTKKVFGKYSITKTGKKKGKPVEIKICVKKPKNTKDFLWEACGNSHIPRNKKTDKWGINFNGINNSFLYNLDIDYDSYEEATDCGKHGCVDICRCAQITHAELLEGGLLKGFTDAVVRQIYPRKFKYCKDIQEFIEDVDFIENTEILTYAIDRLARHYGAFNKDNYEICTSGGYYGDEVGDITFNYFEEFKNDLRRVLKNDYHRSVLELLSIEYDGVPNSILTKLINDGRKFKEITVSFSDLEPGINNYSRLLRKKSDRYPDICLYVPIGVYHKVGDKFILIDGYHRYFGVNHEKEVKIISI